LSPVLPLLVAWPAAAVLALLDSRRRPVAWLTVGVLAVVLAASLILLADVLAHGPRTTVSGGWPFGVGIVLTADALGATFAAVSVAVILAAVVFEVLDGVTSRSFGALALFLTAGLCGVFLTGDVFNFYVFFELAMAAAYALTTYGLGARQIRAGLVFAVVNLLGSFIFLIAVAGLYRVTGTLTMELVAERIADVDVAATLPIAVSLLVAFLVKLGLFPFHFWLPTVYASARPAVAAILGGALANIGAYGLLRFGADILPADLRVGAPVLIVLGTASLLYGSVQAVSRRSAPEVLAYSSIGQVGYVIVAIAIGGPVGYAAAILYAVVNSLNKVLLFLASELRGWLVGFAFVVGALSVAGMPPAAGFLGKLEVFRAGLEGGAVVVGLLVLGSALSFVYMFQIYQHDFWRERRSAGASVRPVGVVVGCMGVVVLALGLWPEPLLAVSRRAATVLAGGEG
jgi:multicomponent Na+:H+ antiporter subunit D